jgi:hypothetical protein
MVQSLLINLPSRITSCNTVIVFFSEQFNWRPKLDDLAFDSIEMVEATRLEGPFDEKEVLEMVKGMNGDKAPGLDGFSMTFFQAC